MMSEFRVEMEHPYLGNHHALSVSPRIEWPTLEARVEALESERSINELLASYATLYDSGDLDAVAGLFCEDAVLRNLLGTFTGVDEIRAGLGRLIAALQQRMHFVISPVVRLHSATSASAASYLYSVAVMRKDGRMYGTCGTYFDRLVKLDGAWRISQRQVTGQMAHALTPLPAADTRFNDA
ncbi:MAG: nuclear transport factor 2 family protein [Acidimicrobiales bacterium]